MRSIAAAMVVAVAMLVGCSSSSAPGATTSPADDAGAVTHPDTGAATGSDAGADPAVDAAIPGTDAGASEDASDATAAPTATVSGKAGGVSIAAIGGLAARTMLGKNENVRVAIFEQAMTCGMVSSGHYPPGEKLFAIDVYAGSTGSTATQVTPGVYPLGNDGMHSQASFTVQRRETDCTLTFLLASDPAKDTGSVTIDAIDAVHVKGSFTLTLGSGGTLTGTFDTTFCAAGPADAGAGTC